MITYRCVGTGNEDYKDIDDTYGNTFIKKDKFAIEFENDNTK